jgi:hypothetical protein
MCHRVDLFIVIDVLVEPNGSTFRVVELSFWDIMPHCMVVSDVSDYLVDIVF